MAQTYHHGAMDVGAQLGTYHHFLVALRYVAIAIFVTLSFLVLAFCGFGIGQGLVVALIELALGLWLARDRPRIGLASEFGALFMSTAAEHPHPVEDQAAEERAEAARDAA